MNILKADILHQFPFVDDAMLDTLLAEEIADSPVKLVVLDDDPTGGQTVHDVNEYTDWSLASIRSGFAEDNPFFLLLTNSRGMTEAETTRVHTEIAERVAAVSEETGIPYMFLSRSDSTLRGHYPLETEVLRKAAEGKGEHIDGEIICPFFKEGGRFTIHNVHYVLQEEELIPAGQTEFARDRSFGYHCSSLPEYIEEKTKGTCPADKVTCISLDTLRSADIDAVETQLLAVRDFGKVCVNAVDYCDLKVFCIAVYRAMAKGKKFLFRTAASGVKVMAGNSDRPLLTRREMVVRETPNGGIVVVGSHTNRTTRQLEELLKLDSVVPVEFDSNKVLEGDQAFSAEVDRCVAEEEKIIQSGKTAVCFTCRTLLTLENDTRKSALLRSVKISDGVQGLVGRLSVTPAFIIAKGGITSSDIAVRALGVKKARVMGQIRPSVPVWQTGEESRFPLTPYVIFPGNTGTEKTLREAVEILAGKE